MINVVIISNHPAKDIGLLSQHDDMSLLRVLPITIDSIIEQIGEQHPDIIIIANGTDTSSPDRLCHFLSKHYRDARILILTDVSPTFEMLENSGFRARGYITPDQHEALAKAVRVVFDGEAWLPRKLVTEMLNRFTASFIVSSGSGVSV
jgi:DNA-binding NarL/FixJ family response regulator